MPTKFQYLEEVAGVLRSIVERVAFVDGRLNEMLRTGNPEVREQL